MDENYNVMNHWVRYLFSSQKNSWMGFLCVTKEFKFPLRILRSAPAGRSRGLQHKQDPADGDRTRSQRQINSSLQCRLGWPRNPICSLSRVTQQPHIRPFTLPLLGLLPLALRVWGPWVSGSLCHSVCVCVCVFVCVQWTQKKVTSYDMKADSRILSELEGPQCWQSCSCLLTVIWVKFVCWPASSAHT